MYFLKHETFLCFLFIFVTFLKNARNNIWFYVKKENNHFECTYTYLYRYVNNLRSELIGTNFLRVLENALEVLESDSGKGMNPENIPTYSRKWRTTIKTLYVNKLHPQKKKQDTI